MKINNTCSKIIIIIIVALVSLLASCKSGSIKQIQEEMQSMYGENSRIEGSYDASLAVKCKNGTFVGQKSGDVISFKGIPFAKAPVGDLRWKAPVEVDADEGVYQAYYFGKSPLQSLWPSEVGSYYPQGEDCLNLNVWVNDSNKSKDKTVMVFIHGGSYGWGAASDPLYDGTNLVAKFDDIILVTIEYRLGMMGFIDFSAVEGGEDYAESGNLGLLDQVCALKWVKENISGFGGDCNNITVFGESAGGGSVSLLPLIKDCEGLFNRVIAESGSVCLSFSREECQSQTQLLLEESGCKNMQELLSLSEERLMEIEEEISDNNCFPERDGVVLPLDLYASYEKGEYCDIDMMIGTNADECRYWIKEMGLSAKFIPGILIYKIGMPRLYKKNLEQMSEADLKSIEDFRDLLDDKKVWEITEFYNEMLFRLPAIKQCESFSANGDNAYNYYWTKPGNSKVMGACHAVELPYIFNNLENSAYTGDTINRELADEVQEMWVNFARCGDPSTENNVWGKYDTETRLTMVLGDEIYSASDFKKEQRELLDQILKYNLNGSYSDLF